MIVVCRCCRRSSRQRDSCRPTCLCVLVLASGRCGCSGVLSQLAVRALVLWLCGSTCYVVLCCDSSCYAGANVDLVSVSLALLVVAVGAPVLSQLAVGALVLWLCGSTCYVVLCRGSFCCLGGNVNLCWCSSVVSVCCWCLGAVLCFSAFHVVLCCGSPCCLPANVVLASLHEDVGSHLSCSLFTAKSVDVGHLHLSTSRKVAVEVMHEVARPFVRLSQVLVVVNAAKSIALHLLAGPPQLVVLATYDAARFQPIVGFLLQNEVMDHCM